MSNDLPKVIARLNDAFRTAGPSRGDWMITSGTRRQGSSFVEAAIQSVRSYDTFNASNDPYGERDFGAFLSAGKRVFWKIDYYDRTLTEGSPDPSDESLTRRILTIMLASEY